MLSDGQNANLASASAQQLPALRTFKEYQDIAVNRIWIPIYKRVLDNAIKAGVLPEHVQEYDGEGEPMFEDDGQTPKLLDVYEAFSLEAPELESDDPNTLAQALQISVNNGWVSDETAAGQMGFDWTSEQKKIARQEKTQAVKTYGPMSPMGNNGQGIGNKSAEEQNQPNGEIADEQQQAG